MSESGIVTRDELLAMGCVEVSSGRGRSGYVISDGVYAVECTKCRCVKLIKLFNKDVSKLWGIMHCCKKCERAYYQANREVIITRSKVYNLENKEVLTKKNKIYRMKNKEELNKRKLARYHANKYEAIKYMQDYYQKNKGAIAKRKRAHYQENPLRYKLACHVRRARINSLPNDLTTEQMAEINATFGNTCALTGRAGDIHADHVIPLSIGHGGTTYGNMIPLRTDLNLSKNASHIFEWFEANRERFNLSQRKFDELIEYLAQINEMTTQEYRAYVDWCFDNPRDINAMEATG